MHPDEEMKQQEPKYLLREKITQADKKLAWCLECLGDTRTPDAQGMEGADIVDQMLEEANVLLQRLEYLREIILKL